MPPLFENIASNNSKRTSASSRYRVEESPVGSPEGQDMSSSDGAVAEESIFGHTAQANPKFRNKEQTIDASLLSSVGVENVNSQIQHFQAPSPAPRPKHTASSARGVSSGKPEFLTGIIATVNELQDLFSQMPRETRVEVDLPQVAVVGSQSSGKSSVLESLVGRDFLPRNKDICTRRPLLLQLHQTTASEGGAKASEWAEFLHHPGQKYTSFSDVRQEIEAETVRYLGSNWNVSADPITLKIFSPNVLTMTLIDLPGITKVPVGDQPRDVEDILVRMTKHYIDNPACIILAVSPGNSDIANSEAIKLAQQADPEGVRTLGVITKVDIMDEGTDVRDYLLGKRAPTLKLGYVAVVNRSQMDINKNIPVGVALRAEQEWFESSTKGKRSYADIAAGTCGTRVLALRVNNLLKVHIQKLVPSLSSSLRSQERAAREELAKLGLYDISSHDSASATVRRAVGQFEREFAAGISGDAPGSRTQLYGGARIANQLQIFSQHLRESLSRLVSYTDVEIFHAIRNVYGVEGQMLMADKAFRHLLPPAVKQLEEPCQEAVRFILEELEVILADAMKRVAPLKHFPALADKIREVSSMCLKDAMGPTTALVSNLIAMEAGYININHPNFIGGQAALTKAMEIVEQREKSSQRDKPREKSACSPQISGGPQGHPLSDTDDLSVPRQPSILCADAPVLRDDKLKVETTRACLLSYMEVVVGNLQDAVPKAIMLMLVNTVKDEKLGEYLNMHVNRPDLVEALLQEDPQVTQARNRCRTQLDVLSRAVRVLDEVPEKMRQSTAQMRKSFRTRE
uniref:Dynamin 1-like protein n=1 Tax=Tetraselmis sp. GSL018 TaxID=582737 RepID=A0A061RD34_9CHLO